MDLIVGCVEVSDYGNFFLIGPSAVNNSFDDPGLHATLGRSCAGGVRLSSRLSGRTAESMDARHLK